MFREKEALGALSSVSSLLPGRKWARPGDGAGEGRQEEGLQVGNARRTTEAQQASRKIGDEDSSLGPGDHGETMGRAPREHLSCWRVS